HGFEYEAGHEPGLSDAGLTDEDDVFRLGDKVQLGEGADLPLFDAGLDLEREALQSQQFRHVRASQTRRESRLLTRLPLGTKQLSEQGLQGRARLLGCAERV